ncbi:MAG: sporulation initiation factor Spo0A C-terminal domain-containing protein [Aristaeellaceae bacterium]
MPTRKIHELLLTLGIGRQYLGHGITVEAISMVIEDENCLLCVKQGIFMPIAERRNCDWRTIERNIRTVIHRAWTHNADRLMAYAVYPLKREPTVTEFLDILSSYIMRQPVLRAAY